MPAGLPVTLKSESEGGPVVTVLWSQCCGQLLTGWDMPLKEGPSRRDSLALRLNPVWYFGGNEKVRGCMIIVITLKFL